MSEPVPQPKITQFYSHRCYIRNSITLQTVTSLHSSRKQACNDLGMESFSAFIYTCPDDQTVYSHLPKEEACAQTLVERITGENAEQLKSAFTSIMDYPSQNTTDGENNSRLCENLTTGECDSVLQEIRRLYPKN